MAFVQHDVSPNKCPLEPGLFALEGIVGCNDQVNANIVFVFRIGIERDHWLAVRSEVSLLLVLGLSCRVTIYVNLSDYQLLQAVTFLSVSVKARRADV